MYPLVVKQIASKYKIMFTVGLVCIDTTFLFQCQMEELFTIEVFNQSRVTKLQTSHSMQVQISLKVNNSQHKEICR